MRRRRFVLLAVAGAALALPSMAGAQGPAQDSVAFRGEPAQAGVFTLVSLNATSGPSGENPTGQVTFGIVGSVPASRPVTCLAVSGNTATMNVRVPLSRPPPFDFGIATVQVVDDQPDTFDASVVGRAPTDCSPTPPIILGGPLSDGDITVVDAPPLPTSKEQCKNGGWQSFPGYRNQGDCVSFVATGGKEPR